MLGQVRLIEAKLDMVRAGFRPGSARLGQVRQDYIKLTRFRSA